MSEDVTAELVRIQEGDPEAPGRLLGLVYDDLRRIARNKMKGERQEHTLQPTALVHEAYIRVSKLRNQAFANREMFFRVMSSFMLRELVDHARRKRAAIRGGGRPPVIIDDIDPPGVPPDGQADDDVEATLRLLDEAMTALSEEHPRAARAVELRFFANLSIDDAAAELKISSGTLRRDVVFAKAWLATRIRQAEQASGPGR